VLPAADAVLSTARKPGTAEIVPHPNFPDMLPHGTHTMRGPPCPSRGPDPSLPNRNILQNVLLTGWGVSGKVGWGTILIYIHIAGTGQST